MWPAMREAFQKYAVFRGRSGREEFEGFFIFHVILFSGVIGFFILSVVAGSLARLEELSLPGGIILMVLVPYGLVMFLPMTALVVRRLHDTNRSGWWFWGTFLAYSFFMTVYLTIYIALILSKQATLLFVLEFISFPFSLALSLLIYVVLYFLAQPGNAGDNRFGAALVDIEPDAPVGGLQPQVFGLLRGIARAWRQNWWNFSIRGRVSRSEYWCFTIPAIILFFIVFVWFAVGYLWISDLGINGRVGLFALISGGSVAVYLFFLLIVIGIRRLHDADYNGWWTLTGFTFPFGIMVSLYLAFKPSTAGDNRFGPQPMPML